MNDIPKSQNTFLLQSEYIDNIKRIKIGIWVYFILWLTEGALRKWILPSLSTPLLIIRDPVAIWLIYMAWKTDIHFSNSYLKIIIGITLFTVVSAVLFGHGNILVAAYGARIFLLHFPIIFIIGKVFDRDDVLKLGRVLLYLSAPMALLIYFQFNSPQSSFVNRGVGGDVAGAGFTGALGYSRPPGLFSFTTGNVQFFSFVAVFIIYFLLNQKELKKYLLYAGVFGLLVAIPFSISRTLVFQISVSIIFIISSIARKPQYLGRLIIAVVSLLVVVLLLGRTSFIKRPIDALTARFTQADESEGGILNTLKRVSAGIEEPFQNEDLPFLGYGIGMGTNVGAQLLVGHSDVFLIAEGEWGRIIGELGIVLGISVIIIRLIISFQLSTECYKKLLISDFLPWLLLSISLLNMAQAQWAQPTTLGFCIIIVGLTFASLNTPETDSEEEISNSRTEIT